MCLSHAKHNIPNELNAVSELGKPGYSRHFNAGAHSSSVRCMFVSQGQFIARVVHCHPFCKSGMNLKAVTSYRKVEFILIVPYI